jgi:hypothetical protein
LGRRLLGAGRVWASRRDTFTSAILGPHFERLCREWSLHFADAEVFGGQPTEVCSGTVSDAGNRTMHQVDVAAFGAADTASRTRRQLLAIGEAKWGKPMGTRHLDRLTRIRSLLIAQDRVEARNARLVCYSGAGFTAGLRAAAGRGDVVLVDIAELYRKLIPS